MFLDATRLMTRAETQSHYRSLRNRAQRAHGDTTEAFSTPFRISHPKFGKLGKRRMSISLSTTPAARDTGRLHTILVNLREPTFRPSTGWGRRVPHRGINHALSHTHTHKTRFNHKFVTIAHGDFFEFFHLIMCNMCAAPEIAVSLSQGLSNYGPKVVPRLATTTRGFL